MSKHSLETLRSAVTWTDKFELRHLGPRPEDAVSMLKNLGFESMDALMEQVVPSDIRSKRELDLPAPLGEAAALRELRSMAEKNQTFRSLIGMGYYDCVVPPVIQRNVLENPGWYTQYTPYQAEIAQGRLEALLNFQTMVSDLTDLPISNASLLDEGTAAAEAMAMSFGGRKNTEVAKFVVSTECHPQTLAVVAGRAEPLGIELVVWDPKNPLPDADGIFGVIFQYPASDGTVRDPSESIRTAKSRQWSVILASDLLALTLLKSPGELGADIAVGTAQRFGVPLGFGGPHAGFLATSEAYQRRLPGRLVGVSKDREGRSAMRLALQTREQHIRRDKATSNICTAQVLLAVMSSFYAVHHGPEGLSKIAARTHAFAALLARELRRAGFHLVANAFFDTITIERLGDKGKTIRERAKVAGYNLRVRDAGTVSVSFDERTDATEVRKVLEIFGVSPSSDLFSSEIESSLPKALWRESKFLTHPVFHKHRSETQMLRYIRALEAKDLSLAHSMIPLGSCTMKLNASAELYPITWPEWSGIHPFAPAEQTQGYRTLFHDLERWLCEITGFDSVSLQPNSGAQGEYAGLLVIRAFHQSRNEGHRNICLIPKSAHGTNPASASMAGMRVVAVECDERGNIDLADWHRKVQANRDNLAAAMITYPSTHGVFESSIRQMCQTVHDAGGQVYLDGANMNAQVGLCRPADYGADVCHLNLHKTFCIPHGGGGPGVGPIGVRAHLAAFLPGHPDRKDLPRTAIAPIAAAPWGSAGILPIPWMYIRMMGARGLKQASEYAILNANYVAKRLEGHYPVLYRGEKGWVAHECILDLRDLKREADIEVEDVAKRLMDYGFHAPTVSWPVAGTIMIEPTESEDRAELDRFCDALIHIREESRKVASGTWDKTDNPLKNAPHTQSEIAGAWAHPYDRETAAFPASWVRERKFWPSVARIDSVWGDRNLFCTCPPMSEIADA